MASQADIEATRTINQQLTEAIMLHTTQLERVVEQLKAAVGIVYARDLDKIIRQVQRDLDRIASRGIGVVDQKQFRKMLESVGTTSKKAVDRMRKLLSAELDELAVYERDWLLDKVGKLVPGIGVSFKAPTAESLKAIKSKRPFAGKLMREWFTQLDANTRARVSAVVKEGVANGETTRQMVQRLRGTKALKFTDGVLQASKREATTIAGTSVSHVANHVRQDIYEANKDVIAYQTWKAELDTNTCEVCLSRDGKTWPVGKGPIPPAHPNCTRCFVDTVLKPIEGAGNTLAEINPGKRTSFDGLVPGNLTFGEWLKTRSHAEQALVLGKERARMFREGAFDTKDGKIDPKKLLGANRRMIPVKVLKERGL
jgi:SPP1 gp7 family putative phage head morphogenesis protein